MSSSPEQSWQLLGAVLAARIGPDNPAALAAVRKLIDEKIAASGASPIEDLARTAMGLNIGERDMNVLPRRSPNSFSTMETF
jgi:hypothetical protein